MQVSTTLLGSTTLHLLHVLAVALAVVCGDAAEAGRGRGLFHRRACSSGGCSPAAFSGGCPSGGCGGCGVQAAFAAGCADGQCTAPQGAAYTAAYHFVGGRWVPPTVVPAECPCEGGQCIPAAAATFAAPPACQCVNCQCAPQPAGRTILIPRPVAEPPPQPRAAPPAN